MAQSTVSQHLKVLVDAGLVSYRTERPRSCYRVNADVLDDLASEIGLTIRGCCGDVDPSPQGCAENMPSSLTETDTPDGDNKDD